MFIRYRTISFQITRWVSQKWLERVAGSTSAEAGEEFEAAGEDAGGPSNSEVEVNTHGSKKWRWWLRP